MRYVVRAFAGFRPVTVVVKGGFGCTSEELPREIHSAVQTIFRNREQVTSRREFDLARTDPSMIRVHGFAYYDSVEAAETIAYHENLIFRGVW